MVAVPTTNPPSVFIDSSVYFAASYSASGSARDLFHAAALEQIQIVLSPKVLIETERNILESAAHAHQAFLGFRDMLPHRLVTPSDELVREAGLIVVAKDAPIVAAAYSAGADFLATYDRRDLLSKRHEIRTAFGLVVATPQEILAAL